MTQEGAIGQRRTPTQKVLAIMEATDEGPIALATAAGWSLTCTNHHRPFATWLSHKTLDAHVCGRGYTRKAALYEAACKALSTQSAATYAKSLMMRAIRQGYSTRDDQP